MPLLELRDRKGSLQLNYYENRAVQNMGQCSCLVSDVQIRGPMATLMFGARAFGATVPLTPPRGLMGFASSTDPTS
jgi:hypothetical protein